MPPSSRDAPETPNEPRPNKDEDIPPILFIQNGYFCAEISIAHYTGCLQSSGATLLQYLLDNPHTRDRLLCAANILSTADERAINLFHPHFLIPFPLDRHDDDNSFCRRIRNYLALDHIKNWTY